MQNVVVSLVYFRTKPNYSQATRRRCQGWGAWRHSRASTQCETLWFLVFTPEQNQATPRRRVDAAKAGAPGDIRGHRHNAKRRGFSYLPQNKTKLLPGDASTLPRLGRLARFAGIDTMRNVVISQYHPRTKPSYSQASPRRRQTTFAGIDTMRNVVVSQYHPRTKPSYSQPSPRRRQTTFAGIDTMRNVAIPPSHPCTRATQPETPRTASRPPP
jgi:hypothetical protein